MDKIAASRYFQQATEYKYIKKAMEEVSNTRLMLTVELKSVVGVLAVNIPPPPTDRIWWVFSSDEFDLGNIAMIGVHCPEYVLIGLVGTGVRPSDFDCGTVVVR